MERKMGSNGEIIHLVSINADIPIIGDPSTNAPYTILYYYYLERSNEQNRLDLVAENGLVELKRIRRLDLSKYHKKNISSSSMYNIGIQSSSILKEASIEKLDDLLLFGSELIYSDRPVQEALRKYRQAFLEFLLPLDYMQNLRDMANAGSFLFKQLNNIFDCLCQSEANYKDQFESVKILLIYFFDEKRIWNDLIWNIVKILTNLFSS